MELIIGIGIWVAIFVVWYVRTYPERVRFAQYVRALSWKRRKKSAPKRRAAAGPASSRADFKGLAETVETIGAMDSMRASDAATMVEALNRLMEIEPASAQLWEAMALDTLETALIKCDDCKVPVEKTVKKTGVKIVCPRCEKWLALKNSKVTVIDPARPGIEDWEH
jgi:Zn finger protein HypA/HybF involved in hydrogenase expression